MLPASICHHFLLLGVTLRRNLSHQSSKSWILSLIPAPFLCFRNVAGPLPRLVGDFILQQYEEQASFGVPGTPSGMRGSKAQTSAWYRWHQRASPKHQYLASYLPFCSIYKCATVTHFFHYHLWSHEWQLWNARRMLVMHHLKALRPLQYSPTVTMVNSQ